MSNKGKINIIDQHTFDYIQAQQQQKTNKLNKIQNSKYKKNKKKYALNIASFVLKKQSSKHAKTTVSLRALDKKRYKVNTKKRLSTIKKRIIKSRKEKQQILQTATNNEQVITVNESKTTTENTITVKKLHSNRFRSYCDNTTNKTLQEYAIQFLTKLINFQIRAIKENSIKGLAHKRLVRGFKDVEQLLLVKKLKLVIVATDCEYFPEIAGKIDHIKELCAINKIPCAFILERRKLSYILHNKSAKISCVGILDYSSAEEEFNIFINELQLQKVNYVNLKLKQVNN